MTDRKRGRFSKQCGSTIHEETTTNTELLDLKSKEKIKVEEIQHLLSNNIVTPSTRYICELCLEKCGLVGCSKSMEVLMKDTTENSVLTRCIEIGDTLGKIVGTDLAGLSKVPENIDELNSHNPSKWIRDRPPELVQLLFHVWAGY